MPIDANSNGDGGDAHVEYYEETKLMNQFGFEHKDVLDSLAIYLRDAARTDLLDIESAKNLAEEMRVGKRQFQESSLMENPVGVTDFDELSVKQRVKFLACLSTHAAKGDKVAASVLEKRDHLIRANLKLVVNIARQYYRNAGVDLEDRIQDGNIGLIRAVDGYNPTIGAITTYATPWIKQGIQRAVQDGKGSIIRLPVHISQDLEALCRNFRLQHGRNPYPQEILDLGFSESKLQSIKASKNIVSLSRNIDHSDENSNTLAANVLDENAEHPWQEFLEADQRENTGERIHRLLARLDSRSSTILKERFGLNPGLERGLQKTQKQVGTGLGISRGRIYQLETLAMNQLAKLVALDIALTEYPNCESYQMALVDKVRQRAIELSKNLDIIPGFIIRKLLSEDGKSHTWEKIAEHLQIPVEKVRQIGQEAIARMQSFLIGYEIDG